MQRIYSVEKALLRVVTKKTSQILVAAFGHVPTTGWSNGQLGPWYYVHPPKDGIQDFDFYADEPHGISLPVLTPIMASITIARDPQDYWGKKKPLLGVRVHARSNSIEATFDESDELGFRPFSEGLPLPWPIPWSSNHISGGDLPFPFGHGDGTSDIDLVQSRVRIRSGTTE